MIENPRLRLALAEYGRRIALVLAVVGAVLLVLAVWTALTPPVQPVTEQTERQTFTTEVDHGAVVTSGDSPWATGTELQNHPAYLLNASPVLDLTVETEAPPGATVVQSVQLRTQVVRDGDVVWRDVESLAAEETGVRNGLATTEASIDVRDLRERRAELQQQFAGVGTVETDLVADARYETDQYQGNLSATAPLSVTGRAYWVDGTPSDSDARSTPVTVERTAPVDWSTVLTLVALGLVAVGGAAAAATYRVEADIEWLRQELHRQRYDDWISNGSIPMGVGGEYVSLDSLKDVVDVAIDTNQRVVYDDRRDVFAVISGDVVYYYSKDGDWNRVAWPQADRGEDDGPSFLEAFGMGDDDSDVPEVGAGTPPAGDGGSAPIGESPEQPDDGPLADESASRERPHEVGGEPREDEGWPEEDRPGEERDADAAPSDGSTGPGERSPSDRPFGDDEEE